MPRAVIRLRKDPAYRREAFESGLRRIGCAIADGMGDRDWNPDGVHDLLVLWNRKRGTDEKLADTWERRGGTVLVAENAYLQKTDKSMYAISTHDHNGAGWFPVGPENRFDVLGFPLRNPIERPDGYTLVIGQRGIGSSQMASPASWGEKHMAKLIGRRAKLRAHPGVMRVKTPLETDLAGARDVHIWTSSVGVKALAEGLSVRHYAPHWICSDTGGGLPLHRMTHGQWTVSEIESGEPFARMQAENWGPRWV